MATAKKTAGKKTAARGPAKKSVAGKKAIGKKAASKKAAAKKTASKKDSLVKQKRSTGAGAACWPGFERVPGKEPGTKGSCKPKANQTKGEKKEDAREAAGSRLRKAGGSKAKANGSR